MFPVGSTAVDGILIAPYEAAERDTCEECSRVFQVGDVIFGLHEFVSEDNEFDPEVAAVACSWFCALTLSANPRWNRRSI